MARDIIRSDAIPTTMSASAHTIVVSGVHADGNAAAVARGVTVTQAPAATPTAIPTGRLPSTGASPQGILVAAFVLVAFGTVLATRRRPRT